MSHFRLARDPALLLTLVASVVRLLAAFKLDFTVEEQSLWNAAAAALAGAAVAVWVKREKQVPAILGALNAVLALAVGYGLHWSPEQQTLIVSAVGAVLAFYTRTQVVAPVPAPAPAVQNAPTTDPVP